MRSWSVTARGLAGVEVQGRNWIVALGRGLDELGQVDALMRLACEVLPNGTVIARDITSGTGYVVQVVDAGDGLAEEPTLAGADDATGEIPMPQPDEDPDALEDLPVEVLFELPPDALVPLRPDDDPHFPILNAETVSQACQLALGSARDQIGAESGAVILEDGGHLRFVAVHGPHARKLMGTRLPLGTGVAGFSMERRRSIVVPDAQADPRHCGEVDALTGYVTRAIAVVPLVHDNRALGVLELMNLPEGRTFSSAELQGIQQIAEALAVRIVR
jgi:GAF domain-containing protein